MKNKKYFAVLLLFLSQCAFVFAHSIVKFLTTFFPLAEILLFRFISAPLMLFAFLFFKKIKPNFVKPWLLIFRGVVGVITMCFCYLAFKYGDLGKTYLIFHTNIIWVIIFSAVFFKEVPTKKTLYAIPFAFLGLFLILKSNGFLSHKLGDLFAFCSSILASLVIISIRRLRKEHDAFTIMFVFFTVSFIFLFPLNISNFVIPTWPLLFALILIAVLGYLSQLFMTTAMKYTKASIGSLIGTTGIPLAYFSGIIFFREAIDPVSLFGAIITIIALIIIARYQ